MAWPQLGGPYVSTHYSFLGEKIFKRLARISISISDLDNLVSAYSLRHERQTGGPPMPQHLVQFFDDPNSPRRKKLGHALANSLDEALARAKDQLPKYKATHSTAGYRVEDAVGRTVAIGP